MKKKNVSLNELKVQSFVTSIADEGKKIGGSPVPTPADIFTVTNFFRRCCPMMTPPVQESKNAVGC